MIDRVIVGSIRHRWAVVAGSLAMAVWGAFSAWIAPVDALPDLSENQVIVYAEWPGRGPAEVEARVTVPLSRELRGARGVKVVRSSSDLGASTLWAILDDSADVSTARRDLAERLRAFDSRSTLPAGVVPRLGPDGAATGQIFWYTVEGPGRDLGALRAIQDRRIKPRLSAVPGVAEVASVGGMAAELRVEADPARLRMHKVALADLVAAVSASNGTGSGGTVHRAIAEFVVRAANPLGESGGRFDPDAALRDLRRVVVPTIDGRTVLLEDVAAATLGPEPRRGALEKDGVEVAGGVVLMARGENPLALTRRLKAALRELNGDLPPGVRALPMYDRSPLIEGAVGTVTGTILEAMVSASLCVLLLLKHARAALVVALTLPLSALSAFGVLELLRRLGVADVQVNAMSLAGLAISVGVLVDSAIVMTENVLHTLHGHFGDRRIVGDVSELVGAACRQVGRPIVFSILIILLSFLPVFALGGLEGRMFRPLAATKTLAMAASGVLAITLVPALCAILVRGRARAEGESRIVRGVVEVYRPVLDHLLDRPAALLWVLGATFVFASSAIGVRWLSMASLAGGLLAVGLTSRGWRGGTVGMASLLIVALVADSRIAPLGREFLAPLDEGTVMDMPISVPGMSIAQGVDDLKARDMALCRFPEVAMVVGKLGRAETPTDPAPLDMIETMVDFHPRDRWPARVMSPADALRQARAVVERLEKEKWVGPIESKMVDKIAASSLNLFDAQMRDYAYQRSRELFRGPGFDEATWRFAGLGTGPLKLWDAHVRALDAELIQRGAAVYTRLAIEATLILSPPRDRALADYIASLARLRSIAPSHQAAEPAHHAMSRSAVAPPGLAAIPALDVIQDELTRHFARRLVLWRRAREDLVGFGGELDRAVQMPGWANVWTMPIQNRVDMLATGVNTMLGVRVLGRDPEQAGAVAARVAEVLKAIPGAADVVADPARGKGVVEVRADRGKAARLGVSIGEINAAVEAAMGGTIATTLDADDGKLAVRVRYDRAHRADETSVADILVRSTPPGQPGPPRLIPLAEVADVLVRDGPATIKGEDGRPRSYVRLNVRGRDAAAFVDDARRQLRSELALPEGCTLEWTGQREHERHARRTLMVVIPIVVALIFGLLWWTYRDLADAALMMLSVPGALAGGVVCQWLLGAKFSVTIWVGYIACFGMATATGVIMLVYLRDALARAGGLDAVDAEGLRLAVLDGAAHRLRPKLLTEATIVLGLAPMLWASGLGGEVLRPMAAPVLGGILVADEVIDLLLPVLFYRVRLWRLAGAHGPRAVARAGARRPPAGHRAARRRP